MPVSEHGPVPLFPTPPGNSHPEAPAGEADGRGNRPAEIEVQASQPQGDSPAAVAVLAQSIARSAMGVLEARELEEATQVDFERLDAGSKAEVAERFAAAIESVAQAVQDGQDEAFLTEVIDAQVFEPEPREQPAVKNAGAPAPAKEAAREVKAEASALKREAPATAEVSAPRPEARAKAEAPAPGPRLPQRPRYPRPSRKPPRRPKPPRMRMLPPRPRFAPSRNAKCGLQPSPRPCPWPLLWPSRKPPPASRPRSRPLLRRRSRFSRSLRRSSWELPRRRFPRKAGGRLRALFARCCGRCSCNGSTKTCRESWRMRFAMRSRCADCCPNRTAKRQSANTKGSMQNKRAISLVLLPARGVAERVTYRGQRSPPRLADEQKSCAI